ncbi:MAG: hypothetical protein ACC656_08070, partial [Candidatus Heimdallarchaeota archaeon]
PDGDINQLEELTFEEVFADINTPGIWVAGTENDLQNPKIIVLDGHSTVFTYDQSAEDFPWTAYTEIGQYKYAPKNVGDGIVIFSHNFYFEFKILIGNKEITVESTFDGNAIKVLTLPMKDVPINDLFEVMKRRIEEAVTSEVQEFADTISTSKGKKIELPESISMKIGMKLSLMGIVLTGMKAKKIAKVEIKKEDDIVEQVYEEKTTKMKEMLEVEEKDLKKRKAKKKVAAKVERTLTPKLRARSKGEGSPALSKPLPSPSTLQSAGSPPPVATSPPPSVGIPSPPSPVVAASPSPTPTPDSSTRAAASPVPPPLAKPKPVTPPPLKPAKVAEMEKGMSDEVEEEVLDSDLESGALDEMDDAFIARGMEATTKAMTLRYTHTSYFSKMLLNRAYPLIVKISLEELGTQKSITSVISGERISEKEETLIVSEEDPNVIIRPEFPGCFVVPTEQVVDITDEKIEVKFHVTPLALGTLDGVVKFVQSGKTIHSMNLETKVITHR